MPLYYTPESNDIQKGRSARASDFVEDKDIKEQQKVYKEDLEDNLPEFYNDAVEVHSF